MFEEVAKVDDVAPGGLIAVEAGGKEIILGNRDGKIYAVSRRCGHMNASLELGTLDGYIITCPLHFAQFDLTTGEALSPPVPRDSGVAVIPAEYSKTRDLRTFPVRVQGNVIEVDVEENIAI